jgi:hypothetical protein
VAQTGNGIDLGTVYQLLGEVAERVRSHDAEFVRLNGRLDDLDANVADLRAAVTNYHSTVLGHGVLISELDERVRRIERHLKLEPSVG